MDCKRGRGIASAACATTLPSSMMGSQQESKGLSWSLREEPREWVQQRPHTAASSICTAVPLPAGNANVRTGTASTYRNAGRCLQRHSICWRACQKVFAKAQHLLKGTPVFAKAQHLLKGTLVLAQSQRLPPARMPGFPLAQHPPEALLVSARASH